MNIRNKRAGIEIEQLIKIIIAAVVIVLVVVGGYFAYTKFIHPWVLNLGPKNVPDLILYLIS
jgi:hypothetical protein